MKKLSILLLSTALAASLVTGCATDKKTETPGAAPDSKPIQVKKFQPNENTKPLQPIEENIFGDNGKEKILLYQEVNKYEMPIAWYIVINDEEKAKLVNDGGVWGQASLVIRDVTGDKKPEVLAYRYNTGSAGAQALNIFVPGAENWEKIYDVKNTFDENNPRYEVKYLGDYKVSFADKETGLKTTINLNENNYQGEAKDMVKDISNWVDPIAAYEIMDIDKDGVMEIIAVQRVIGVAHVDTIGLLNTTYKLDGGKYKAVSQELADWQDTKIAEVKL